MKRVRDYFRHWRNEAEKEQTVTYNEEEGPVRIQVLELKQQ